MGSIPTRRVRRKADGFEVTINASDFDPKLHEDPSAKKEPEAPSGAEEKAAPKRKRKAK